MSLLVTCPNLLCRFRFPVNLKKHLYRRERFCPRCHTKVNVRPSRWSFLPNPNWFHQKAEAEYNRQRIKEMKTPSGQRGPAIALQGLPEGLLALSLLLKKQAEEEKKK